MKFRPKYALLTLLLFLVELFIALFVNDKIIRPFLGDFLVVILIYCFFRSFLKLSVKSTAFLVAFIAFGTEILQYFSLVERLGLEAYPALAIAIGRTFDPLDLLVYALGIGAILFLEKKAVKV